MHVAAHAVDGKLLEELLQSAEESAGIISGKRSFQTRDLSGLLNAHDQVARAAARLQPDKATTLDAFRRFSRTGASLYLLARAPAGTPLVTPVDPRPLQGPVNPTVVTAQGWEWVTCTAIGTGDELSRWLLLTSPPPPDSAGIQSAPWSGPLAQALPFLLTQDPRASAALMAAVEATDPDRLEPRLKDRALNVAAPGLEALYRAFADPPGFEAALVKALECHRTFWSRQPKEEQGWIAHLPLCAARLAKERGVRFQVDSEYLPRALLDAPSLPAPGCPYCLAPIDEAWPRCPSCLEDLGRDAPIDFEPGERERMDRKPCTSCRRRIPRLAVVCATCRTRQ